jgi:hypothetical protein
LRLNQETHAPSLHVPGADRTQRHPTSRPPGHRVPDLCDHPRSSALGLLLLSWYSSLHTMPHLPPTHNETSKRDSPNEAKVKEKQKKTIPDSNSNLTKSMTHHNQTKKLITWFLTLVLKASHMRLLEDCAWLGHRRHPTLFCYVVVPLDSCGTSCLGVWRWLNQSMTATD